MKLTKQVKKLDRFSNGFPAFMYGQGDGRIIEYFIESNTKWVLIECKDDEFDFDP